MRLLKTTLLLLFCLLLTGCSSFQMSLTDMMQAPRLTEDQAEIYEAVTGAVGNADVQLKYPRQGKYRSAFVLFDLDADGQEEALVLYNVPSRGDNVRIMILDRPEEKWVPVYDAVGEGTDVTELDFRRLTASGRYNILVGWEKGTSSNTHVSVYDYAAQQLKVLFESDYVQMLLEDIDLDGQDEMLLTVFRANSQLGTLMLINETPEGLQTVSRVFMENNITGFLNVQVGQLAEGHTAVFVDANTGAGEVCTEIMVYSADGLLCNLNSLQPKLNQTFTRYQPVLCEDIDGDGIFDIPVPLDPYDEMEESVPEEDGRKNLICYLRLSDALPLTELKLEENGRALEEEVFLFEPAWSGFVSLDHSYRLQFPARWIGQIQVEKASDRSEWLFSLKAGGVEPPVLLRVRVYSQDEPRDVFDNITYEFLKKRGLYEYYAAPVQSEDVPPEMAIGLGEVKSGFSIIDNK